jgi:hypothetical protein
VRLQDPEIGRARRLELLARFADVEVPLARGVERCMSPPPPFPVDV